MRPAAEPGRWRESAALRGDSIRTEDYSLKKETEADEFADNSITEEELLLAARRSFLFLSACVDGEIADAKVADRIAAARAPGTHRQGASLVR